MVKVVDSKAAIDKITSDQEIERMDQPVVGHSRFKNTNVKKKGRPIEISGRFSETYPWPKDTTSRLGKVL